MMPDRPGQNREDTVWLIHKREDRRARLKTLADSINDSARMARGTVSLLLLVALYLGLTLVVSSDENLLVNGQVALPQTGVGISIVQSYIFAPPIFLYLHIQTLYLLSVLARKVQTYKTALASEFPSATSQAKQNAVEAEREEYWDLLSAFALVQLFRQNNVSLAPIVLIWLSTIVIPLLLLLAIDLSFVRYQSIEITVSHHIFLLLDLLFIELFRRQTLKPIPVKMPRSVMDMGRMLWVYGILFMIIVIFYAFPPRFELSTVKQDREQIWWSEKSEDTKLNKENLLDDSCKLWRVACRYLDVSGKRLVKTRPEDLDYAEILGLSRRNLRFAKFVNTRLTNTNLYGALLQGADLSRAELQGANLTEAQLQGTNLQFAKLQRANLWETQLQGANLWKTQLQGANLMEAQLQGANLEETQLQGANLTQAQLQGANLTQAQLQGANLWETQLQGANLMEAQLQGANLWQAQLQGANLTQAQLQGANLTQAQLQGANLWWAQLQGANLWWAQLQGANLREAQLQGANLREAQLQGANLTQAQLQGSFGKPYFPQKGLILISETSFEWDENISRNEYLDKLLTDLPAGIKLAWKEDATLEDHLRESILRNPRSQTPDGWDYKIYDDYSIYSKDWADWTSHFACQDEYGARSSLRRWRLYFSNPYSERTMAFNSQIFPIYPTETVYKALVDARENRGYCPGLRAIPDDEWQDFYTRGQAP